MNKGKTLGSKIAMAPSIAINKVLNKVASHADKVASKNKAERVAKKVEMKAIKDERKASEPKKPKMKIKLTQTKAEQDAFYDKLRKQKGKLNPQLSIND